MNDSFQPVRIDYARILADTRTTASLALAYAGQIREIKGRTPDGIPVFPVTIDDLMLPLVASEHIRGKV